MTTLVDAFRQANALHQQGRLTEAEVLYRRVLAKDRFHDEALHLLGVLCHQTGRQEEAVRLIKQAIERRRREPEYHSHLGLALEALGRRVESEQAHRRAVSLAPSGPTQLNNLGVLLLNWGRVGEALPLFERAALLKADYAEAYNNIGLCRQRVGNWTGARTAYEKALTLTPTHPVFLNNLGTTLQHFGELDAARRLLAKALEIRPNYPEALNNLGHLLQQTGQAGDALKLFDQALALKPGYADALHNQAHTLHTLGRFDEARERYEAVLAAEPGHLRSNLDLATLLQRQGDFDGALARLWAVVQRDTTQNDAATHFCRIYPLARQRNPADADAHIAAITAILEHDLIMGPIVYPAASILLKTRLAWTSLSQTVDVEALERLCHEPLFLALLPRAVGPDPGFEGRVAAVRAGLLATLGLPGAERFLLLACAVAQHLFLAEYVHDEEAEETTAVASLAERLAATAPAVDPLALAVYAAYRPLGEAPWAATLVGRAWPAAIAELLCTAVQEPAEEAQIAAELPALTPIADEVSRKVQAQYEENPYPRWKRPPTGATPYPFAHAFRRRFPWLADVPLPAGSRELVAGCGTGQQPVLHAVIHPEAQILAVDLSRRSLAYAQRKAREAGVADRIRFAQADILALGDADELGVFDRIYATGVLHHMADPAAGLRALLARLAPGGLVHLGLYSRIARRRLNAVRARARDLGTTPDLAGIRALRRVVKAEMTNPDFAETMVWRDFYSTSDCRDLLLHVQEHQFDLPGVARLLDEAGLIFLAMESEDPRLEPLFRAEATQRGHEPTTALRSLAEWEAFEQRHPGTFRQMYQFFALRPA